MNEPPNMRRSEPGGSVAVVNLTGTERQEIKAAASGRCADHLRTTHDCSRPVILWSIRWMSENDTRIKASRQTRIKNLTAKKADRGELEPKEEKEFQRLIAATEADKTAKEMVA